MTWDSRFLDLAHHVSLWSKDPSTKVGAVLVGNDKRDVAFGYNGPPPGVNDAQVLESRATRLRLTIHAERNVLDHARFATRGATLYVTHPCCSACALSAVSKGVSRVVVCRSVDPTFMERWKDDIANTKKLFQETGVAYDDGT